MEDSLSRCLYICTIYKFVIGKQVLGLCEIFEERQVGNERFNIFTGCPGGETATIVLRGGADQVCLYWSITDSGKITGEKFSI